MEGITIDGKPRFRINIEEKDFPKRRIVEPETQKKPIVGDAHGNNKNKQEQSRTNTSHNKNRLIIPN